jgi:hypothetical protein
LKPLVQYSELVPGFEIDPVHKMVEKARTKRPPHVLLLIASHIAAKAVQLRLLRQRVVVMAT